MPKEAISNQTPVLPILFYLTCSTLRWLSFNPTIQFWGRFRGSPDAPEAAPWTASSWGRAAWSASQWVSHSRPSLRLLSPIFHDLSIQLVAMLLQMWDTDTNEDLLYHIIRRHQIAKTLGGQRESSRDRPSETKILELPASKMRQMSTKTGPGKDYEQWENGPNGPNGPAASFFCRSKPLLAFEIIQQSFWTPWPLHCSLKHSRITHFQALATEVPQIGSQPGRISPQ